MKSSDNTQEFRIYKVNNIKTKGKRAIAWEVVSQLKIGEAVKMDKSVRFFLIEKAKTEGVHIRTLAIKGSEEIEVIRIEKR